MSLIKKYNKKLNELDEKEESKYREGIYEALQVIANLSNLLEPFMPKTAEVIRGALDIEENIWSCIEKKNGEISNLENLFKKLDKKIISDETKRLKEEKN